jgi:drug/metabolite transporter (DMT)-like permease
MVMVGSSVAAASLLTAYPVLTGQAARYATAAALLWAFTRARGRRLPKLTRRDAGWLVAVAAFGLSGFNYVLIEATARIDPSVVGAVLGATPIVLAILAPLQDRRPIAARTAGAAVAVTAGVVVVQRAAGPLDPLGLALAMLVLVGETGFALFAVPPLRRIGPIGVSFHATWIGAVQLVLGAMVLERGDLRLPTLPEVAALAHMAVLVTVVAFVAWYSAISRLNADRAGLFLGLVPVTALITSALVGTATVTPATVSGCVIVALAVTAGASRRANGTNPSFPGRHARLPAALQTRITSRRPS